MSAPPAVDGGGECGRPLGCPVVDTANTASTAVDEDFTFDDRLSKGKAPPLSPPPRPYDPFNRTRSELKLCGELVAYSESDKEPFTPINRWPPRPNGALALDALRVHRFVEAGLKPSAYMNLKLETARREDSLFVVPEASKDAVASEETDVIIPIARWPLCLFLSSYSVPSKPTVVAPAIDPGIFADWVTHDATASMLNHLGVESWHADRHVIGAVVLSGSFEEHPADICDALRRALLAVVEPVVGSDAVLSVWRCSDHSASNAWTHEIRRGSPGKLGIDYNAFLKFNFEAVFLDPFERALALEALKLEATIAGATKLLPELISLLPDAGRAAVRLEVEPGR